MVFVVSHKFRGHSATQFFEKSQVIQVIGVSNFAPFWVYKTHMDVSLNGGTPKSSILIGFSI